MTCDAWQASNTDAYFAVTGSWIQEGLPGIWEMKTVLLGFAQMNSAHNGSQLGQALYQVVERLGIMHKVIDLSLTVYYSDYVMAFTDWPRYV